MFVHTEILKNYEAVCTAVLVPLLTLAHFSLYAGDGALYRVDINTQCFVRKVHKLHSPFKKL